MAVDGGQSLGVVINTTRDSLAGTTEIFSAICYLMGLFLIVSAILRVKEHVEVTGPNRPKLQDPVMRFIAAGSFFSAPFLASVLQNSIIPDAERLEITSRSDGTLTGNSLDALVFRVMHDITGPVTDLLSLVSYLFAFAFLLVGINRLTKVMEHGPRGPAGAGTIMTFITSGVLFSFGSAISTFTASLFGDSKISTRATIDAAKMGVNADDLGRIESVIEAVMAFIMIVGFIAFLRGIFVLRAFADGGHQGATLAQGLTFLLGGSLAINLGDLINAVQATLRISGLTFT